MHGLLLQGDCCEGNGKNHLKLLDRSPDPANQVEILNAEFSALC
jgi:hypothetical protein